MTSSSRIFPRYAPTWLRPAWCFLKRYHQSPIDACDLAHRSQVKCGCCGKVLATVITAEGLLGETRDDAPS